MKSLLLALSIAFLSTSPAIAAEPVVVLGLPIGGPLKISPRVCPFNSEKSKVPCWVGSPYKHTDGTLLGSLHLPDRDSLPKWAAYASFDAKISRKNVLDQLKVKTIGTDDLVEIQASISGRFGAPTSAPTRSPTVYSITWAKTDIHVKMLCSISEFCLIELSSPAYRAAYEGEMDQRRATDAARPKTL